MEVKLSEGRLVGAAADWFRSEAAKAQFVFIGEEHDVREIPLITAALWRELVPLGYKHMAIEAGQWLGGRLDRFARFGDREALAQFQAATWPRLPNNSVPPISREDLEFYELIGKVSGPHKASEPPLIWGLDYEYRAAPLLKRLAELSSSPAKQLIASLLRRVEAAEATGTYDTRAFKAEIDKILRSIRAKAGTEAFQIREALRWRAIEPADSQLRSIKKELFLRDYLNAKGTSGSSPRVVLRFGSYHAARGLMRDFGTSTLANFVAEFGVTERSTLLNVLFINCSVKPAAFPRPCTREEQEWLKPLNAAAVAPWTLFDLRELRQPMRRRQLKSLQSRSDSREYWNLVMAFDAVVFLRDSERSDFSER